MPTLMDPTSSGFLLAESRNQPMHGGGLQLLRKPVGARRTFVKDLYDQMLTHEELSPLFAKRPYRSVGSAGAWTWVPDENFDLQYHVRHSALPRPGRIRELLELCGRLHSTRLALDRPLWEVHLIEGLHDGRLAIYSKMHHALVDGVSAMRLLQRVLSEDPDARGMAPVWSAEHARRSPVEEAVGPGPGGVSARAPRMILNTSITGARRFAAEDWPIDRVRAVGRRTGTTINDVVLAMCSGRCVPTSTSSVRCPGPLWWRWCRSPSPRRTTGPARRRGATRWAR